MAAAAAVLAHYEPNVLLHLAGDASAYVWCESRDIPYDRERQVPCASRA